MSAAAPSVRLVRRRLLPRVEAPSHRARRRRGRGARDPRRGPRPADRAVRPERSRPHADARRLQPAAPGSAPTRSAATSSRACSTGRASSLLGPLLVVALVDARRRAARAPRRLVRRAAGRDAVARVGRDVRVPSAAARDRHRRRCSAPGFWTATIAIAIIYVPLLARVVRGSCSSSARRPYVDACRVQGFSARCGSWALHVLPNCRATIAAQSTLNFGYALLDLAALAFLGLGVQPPTADWGRCSRDGRETSCSARTPRSSRASVAIVVDVVAVQPARRRAARPRGARTR